MRSEAPPEASSILGSASTTPHNRGLRIIGKGGKHVNNQSPLRCRCVEGFGQAAETDAPTPKVEEHGPNRHRNLENVG
jgi:hypothetical protein